jgi:REP element-mobilizing transposase RayT
VGAKLTTTANTACWVACEQATTSEWVPSQRLQLLWRQFMRLPGYDYSNDGFYFITISTEKHRKVFADMVNDKIQNNHYGNIALNTWFDLPNHFDNIILHEFIVMPNHLHGIIQIDNHLHLKNKKPFDPTRQGSISLIVRFYKSAVTRQIRETMKDFKWRNNFYDHVIRNEQDRVRIVKYINENPDRWEMIYKDFKNYH